MNGAAPHFVAVIRLGTGTLPDCGTQGHAHASAGEAARCLAPDSLVVFAATGLVIEVTGEGRRVVAELVGRRVG